MIKRKIIMVERQNYKPIFNNRFQRKSNILLIFCICADANNFLSYLISKNAAQTNKSVLVFFSRQQRLPRYLSRCNLNHIKDNSAISMDYSFKRIFPIFAILHTNNYFDFSKYTLKHSYILWINILNKNTRCAISVNV